MQNKQGDQMELLKSPPNCSKCPLWSPWPERPDGMIEKCLKSSKNAHNWNCSKCPLLAIYSTYVPLKTCLLIRNMASPINPKWLKAAIDEAKKGLAEGGLPIGSVLVDPEGQGRIISVGHNLRVQNDDPTAHAEMVCIRKAGRRKDWHKLVLVSTLRYIQFFFKKAGKLIF